MAGGLKPRAGKQLLLPPFAGEFAGFGGVVAFGGAALVWVLVWEGLAELELMFVCGLSFRNRVFCRADKTNRENSRVVMPGVAAALPHVSGGGGDGSSNGDRDGDGSGDGRAGMVEGLDVRRLRD